MACLNNLDQCKDVLPLVLRIAECLIDLPKETRESVAGHLVDGLKELNGLDCLKELIGGCDAADVLRLFRLLSRLSGNPVDAVVLAYSFGLDTRDAAAWALKQGASKAAVEAYLQG